MLSVRSYRKRSKSTQCGRPLSNWGFEIWGFRASLLRPLRRIRDRRRRQLAGAHEAHGPRLRDHLMPGNEEEAAALLDAYLERAKPRGRLKALDD